MQPIDFIGIRGGHGTTTIAVATAVILAAEGPTRIATSDRRALCAVVGIAHDGLPIPIASNLELSDDLDADVTDAETLETYLEAPIGEKPVEGHVNARLPLRIGVLRGPDYLGLRTLCEHPGVALDGLVVVSETGRALDARDVEHVSGRPVVAVIDHTPAVARMIDAGLFTQRIGRLREFTQLRNWITQLTSQEPSCAASS